MTRPGSNMAFRSTLSQRVDALDALYEAIERLEQDRAWAPDLVTLFCTPHHVPLFEDMVEVLQQQFPHSMLIGCSAIGVIGGGHEAERREALSLSVGLLPGATLHPVRLEGDMDPDPDWVSQLGPFERDPHFVLLPDPFTCDVDVLLSLLDDAFPDGSKVGGLISGADAPGDSVMVLDGNVYRDGLVGVAIAGEAHVDPIVAQGCRPIGDAMIVTRIRDNVVYELNVGKPVDALQNVYRHLSPRDQELCHHSLFLGVEMHSKTGTYGQGDFLLGDVLGMDPKSGAMAIGRPVRDYQVVQFHLCDAETSAVDLRRQLVALNPRAQGGTQAAMLFCCVGRGEALYGVPDHDADMIRRHLGDVPVFGFFSSGEIGQVGRRTFVHGYTTAAALLQPRKAG
ncbi:MAG: FIST C-terminal domain-containing protein [Myxococcales bacterium]|nr:FIST C-terminal domain-containing protein [Myxococcales bacterium]